MGYLSAVWTAIYYVAYPIFYFLAIITAPLLHLGHYCLSACWYASRVLGQFETLYIFFGIAALVGIITGTCLHYVSSFVVSMLDLESSSRERRGRTLAFYGAEKQDGWDAKDLMMRPVQNDEGLQRNKLSLRKDHTDWRLSKKDRRQSGNRFNTILEEEDTSDGF